MSMSRRGNNFFTLPMRAMPTTLNIPIIDDSLDSTDERTLRNLCPLQGSYNPTFGERSAIEIEVNNISDNVPATQQARPWVFGDAVLDAAPPPRIVRDNLNTFSRHTWAVALQEST